MIVASGNRVFPGHQCNAYCRGTVHAQVIWVDIAEAGPAVVDGLAREICQRRGANFLAVAHAPEAKAMGNAVWDYDVTTGRWQPSDLPGTTPFLVTYDEGQDA